MIKLDTFPTSGIGRKVAEIPIWWQTRRAGTPGVLTSSSFGSYRKSVRVRELLVDHKDVL